MLSVLQILLCLCSNGSVFYSVLKSVKVYEKNNCSWAPRRFILRSAGTVHMHLKWTSGLPCFCTVVVPHTPLVPLGAAHRQFTEQKSQLFFHLLFVNFYYLMISLGKNVQFYGCFFTTKDPCWSWTSCLFYFLRYKDCTIATQVWKYLTSRGYCYSKNLF